METNIDQTPNLQVVSETLGISYVATKHMYEFGAVNETEVLNDLRNGLLFEWLTFINLFTDSNVNDFEDIIIKLFLDDLSDNISVDLSPDELEKMIKSEQILLEKFSNNNYQATLNISFSKKFIAFYLKNKNDNLLSNNDSIQNLAINKAEKPELEDVNKQNILILPVKKQGNNFMIWEEKNEWKSSVEKSLQKNKLATNNEILILKNEINNLEIINNENIEDLQYLDFEPILIQQKSDNLYLTIFEYDEIENKARIIVKNFSKNPKKTVILNFVNVEFLKYSELLDKVSLKLIEYLLNNKNSINSEANQNNITLDIEINDFESWIKIQQKIINSGLMSNIFLKSISKQKTTISGNYLGNKNKIKMFYTFRFYK